jgi:hypothetical protein
MKCINCDAHSGRLFMPNVVEPDGRSVDKRRCEKGAFGYKIGKHPHQVAKTKTGSIKEL